MSHIDCENIETAISSLEKISRISRKYFIPFLKRKYEEFNTIEDLFMNNDFESWILSEFILALNVEKLDVKSVSFFHMSRLPEHLIEGIIQEGLKPTKEVFPRLIKFLKELFPEITDDDWKEIESSTDWIPFGKLDGRDEFIPHGFGTMEWGLKNNDSYLKSPEICEDIIRHLEKRYPYMMGRFLESTKPLIVKATGIVTKESHIKKTISYITKRIMSEDVPVPWTYYYESNIPPERIELIIILNDSLEEIKRIICKGFRAKQKGTEHSF